MKRSVAAVLLCVTTAGCASGSGGAHAPSGTPATPRTATSVAIRLAGEDGHPAQGARYLRPVRRLAASCRSLLAAETVVTRTQHALHQQGIATSNLVVLTAFAGAGVRGAGGSRPCARFAAQYTAEVVGTGPARSSSGWGGYGGTLAAWNAVHEADRARPGQYLPRRHGADAYQLLSSGQVTSLIERFDPPISAGFALAQVTHDLLPGKVHVVYRLHTGQCQQTIYLGRQLGALLHDPGLGAFVELTSGRGVGHTHYDDQRVDRARITPLGAIGGEPCS
jgi:hypothetical protein